LQCFAKLPDWHLSCQSRKRRVGSFECDLVADGTQQIERPPNGGLSRWQSLAQDNSMIDLLQGAIRVG
jgi:hypothetical protein